MKTSRKPAPIQDRTLELWAFQFIRFVEEVSATATDYGAACRAVSLAFGCMAELANFRGDEYDTARLAALEYARAVTWVALMTSTYNTSPWRDNDFPATMRAALVEADALRDTSRRTLENALRALRPSLSLT